MDAVEHPADSSYRMGSLSILKWAGTLACAAMLLAAGVTSCLWTFISVGGPNWFVGIQSASFAACWFDNNVPVLPSGASAPVGKKSAFESGVRVGPHYESWQTFVADVSRFAALPQMRLFKSRRGFAVFVPLWMPFVLFGLPTIWLWRLDRKFPKRTCRCGYDLTGNTSGRCPECGTATTAPPANPPDAAP